MQENKTHYRRAFNSPYLSSADVVGEVVLTIARVALEPDKTKRTKDLFNTAYFVQEEIRPGEPLKPMILNAINSRYVNTVTGSPYIDDWNNIPVTVYVDPNVKHMGEIVEGLRLKPAPRKKNVTKDNPTLWENAKKAYRRDGHFEAVLVRANISEGDQLAIIQECANA